MSLADRPYGSFPRDDRREPAGPPVTPRAPRWYEPAPGRRAWLIRRYAFGASVALFALAVLASPPPLPAPEGVASVSPAPTLPVPDLYERLAKSVVEVRASGAAPAETRVGAGVVVEQSGAILTALHVVQSGQLSVRFFDGTQARAAVVATLPESDIAVLLPSLLPPGVEPAVLGDPRALRVGDEALVIGSPYGLTRTLSVGVVSGLDRSVLVPPLDREIPGLIQVDAAVNPGDSGGPLVDGRGEVVGIVIGVPRPSDSSTAVGIGFAVTIDDAAGALGLPPD